MCALIATGRQGSACCTRQAEKSYVASQRKCLIERRMKFMPQSSASPTTGHVLRAELKQQNSVLLYEVI